MRIEMRMAGGGGWQRGELAGEDEASGAGGREGRRRRLAELVEERKVVAVRRSTSRGDFHCRRRLAWPAMATARVRVWLARM